MDRYDNLDLDLECEGGGGVSQKAALFGGMFKKSSKNAEPSAKAQDSLSTNGELSKSNDSLSDNSSKDKGGMLKGMFKKTNKPAKEGEQQASMSMQKSDLSASSDSLTENKTSKEKSGVLGGLLKRSPRPGHVRRPSQDLLDVSANNDNQSDNTNNTKESGGFLAGMFKKSPKFSDARAPSQEDLSADRELSGSKDDLSNNKESGGMFSGMFKKSPKSSDARAQSQEDLSADRELSGSKDDLSNKKESGGVFSGMFKKSPNALKAKTQSQEDLSADSELSGSSDNLSENHTKEKGGIFGMFRKKGAKYQSQEDLSVDEEHFANNEGLTEKPSKEKEKTENSGDSSAPRPKAKHNGFSAMMKSTFYINKQEKGNTDEEMLDGDEDSQPSHKQSKVAGAVTKLNPFRAANKHEKQSGSDDEAPAVSSGKASSNKQSTMAEAMSKLNPFRSANKKDTEDAETALENEKQLEEKPKLVKSNLIQPERKERSETPPVPHRSTKEEMKGMSAYNKVKQRRPEEKSQSGDEGTKDDESVVTKDGDESKTTKGKKHRINPFMPQVAVKAASDDEGLKDDEESSSRQEKKDEEGKDKTEETKVKKPKRHNPFMPRVKAKVIQKHEDTAGDDAAENEGANRSLFDRLEDFRIEPSQPEGRQDMEDLMDWWNTVESWEDTPQDEDMTEKEEAKAFAVTAEKVQKGIRVFNKLFSERAESLWQHVIDLNSMAEALDKFNKKTKIAQITGGSTSAIGGVATIAGLALAPVTMGTSLIVTAVGLGVATAGGLTSAGAGISNQVNNSMDRKKVEKIVEDYQEKMIDLNKCLKFIKQGIENLRRFDLIKMKKHAYNRDFPALTSSFYEDGAMAGKAILINANEIMRVVQIANVAGSTAARAVQIASMATGVLTGLFVGMDIYFVAKDSKELKKGAKSEFAAKIREVATQLHDGLVELNSIREELQSTGPENSTGSDTKALSSDTKEKDYKSDSSEEDEIDRIKKAIKKDIENRDYGS